MDLEIDRHKTSFNESLLKVSEDSESNERMVFSDSQLKEIIRILLESKTNPNTKDDSVLSGRCIIKIIQTNYQY